MSSSGSDEVPTVMLLEDSRTEEYNISTPPTWTPDDSPRDRGEWPYPSLLGRPSARCGRLKESDDALAMIAAQEEVIKGLYARCQMLEALAARQRTELEAQALPGAAAKRYPRWKPKESKTERAAAGIAQKVLCKEYQHPLRSTPTMALRRRATSRPERGWASPNEASARRSVSSAMRTRRGGVDANAGCAGGKTVQVQMRSNRYG
mmetsp:Transcript_85253/g.204239  ORF Transcript_85253/g.204239 Transcript_85253/m.204239 type:complete len:206 (-) Transcript_85253:123-740(-)